MRRERVGESILEGDEVTQSATQNSFSSSNKKAPAASLKRRSDDVDVNRKDRPKLAVYQGINNPFRIDLLVATHFEVHGTTR